MYLYNFTLQKPTSIYCTALGNFSGVRVQEIAVSRGRYIELLRPDSTTGKLSLLTSCDVYGIIRSVAAFRLPGGSKDYLVIGSDSGRIAILEYNQGKNVHLETFGKSGCRRIVPGQYLAIDPKGRAVMISAVEKQKFVYILNRDNEARLTISSPLEAHKSHGVVFATVGLDVGFENPVFCCLEMDYEEADWNDANDDATPQLLTFYELDLGLNHVVRKSSEPLDAFANILLPVPGSPDGPGGVLVCCENTVLYKNINDDDSGDMRVPIPRRKDDFDNADRKMMIVCATFHKTKTDQGDVFKVTLDHSEGTVTDVRIKYFDTLETVGVSLTVLRSGFLFVASDHGNHGFYQILKLGDEDDGTEFLASVYRETETMFYFQPRSQLSNLILVNELNNVSPILDCHVVDLLQNDSPQIHMLCGRGNCSQFGVNEMGVSELPGDPMAVWTLKKHRDVSFVNATLVLSVGETVEEISDSGFLPNVSTLGCCVLGEDSLIQIYVDGIRHIRADKRINEWRCPPTKKVNKCTTNNRQIVITLSSDELIYFELDEMGQLSEYTERKEIPSRVVSLALGPVPKGEQRSKFLALALRDNTVRIISLDPNVSVLDSVTGDLTDTRTRYLGAHSVRLFRVTTNGSPSVLAVSSRNWLSYYYQNRFHLTPLSFDTLEYGTSFTSEQCPEGIVAVKGNSLHIISVEKLGNMFEYRGCRLKYTPRKMLFEPNSSKFLIIETDHNTFTTKELEEIKDSMAQEMREFMNEQPDDSEITEDTIAEFLRSENTLATKAGPGTWASLVRVLDPLTLESLQTFEFDQDEAAFSIALARFPTFGSDSFLVIGTAHKYKLSPRHCNMGFLHTFRVAVDKNNPQKVRLHHLHKTPVEEVPGAIACFQGRLIVGIGKLLRIYDMGRQKLLKKCEHRKIPCFINSIVVNGNRIIVQDIQESFHYLRYKPNENKFVIFADDSYPRWLTKSCILDWNTIMGADKFGNISVNRLADNVKDDLEEDPTGVKSLWDKGHLNGAPQKLENICNFYLGEVIHSLQKTSLIAGGSESVIYTTLSGTIGLLVPLSSREDVDFFQLLEMYMRQESQPICGRDHLSFRSYYWPAKNVIDGDLCEFYNNLDVDKRRSIADELDRTPAEVSKKLEEIRTRFAF